MDVDFRTKYQYEEHQKFLTQSIPQILSDLVQIIQQYCVMEIVVGMHLDCLDSIQMWLEGQVLQVDGLNRAYIHYVGYHSKYDEWIYFKPPENNRLTLLHMFTPTDEATGLLSSALQVSEPTDENKTRRIARFVSRGWNEPAVVEVYKKFGWQLNPSIINQALLVYSQDHCLCMLDNKPVFTPRTASVTFLPD